MLYINLIIALVIVHFASDNIQTGYAAEFKRPRSCDGWFYVLLGHSSLQALAVAATLLLFGFGLYTAVAFAFVEAVVHATIDAEKANGKFGIHADQLMHIACRAAYVVALQIPQLSWLWIGVIAGMAILPVIAAVVLVVVINGNREVTK